MKTGPNSITWNGITYPKGKCVRCHLGYATIATLYPPHANEPEPKAMLDRGPSVDARLRYPIVRLDKLELMP